MLNKMVKPPSERNLNKSNKGLWAIVIPKIWILKFADRLHIFEKGPSQSSSKGYYYSKTKQF